MQFQNKLFSSDQFTCGVKLTKKMRLLPLVGATYFMVAGGPYGIEDIMGQAGFGLALALLVVVPLVWSLPTALMVGELASAIPDDGGYYVWVRRALGGFWGFQEAWLSLAASVFDMALYPVTFVLYLQQVAPGWTAGHGGMVWTLAVVAGCVVWNLRGAKAVGGGSVWLFVVMLAPFAVLVGIGFWHGLVQHAGGLAAMRRPIASPNLLGALSVCLWNYMGWDNASTVAQEVENPQRNYPRAMLMAAGLVAATYVLPLAAVAFAGIPAEQFSTGSWVESARQVALQMGAPKLFGGALALAVVAGGMISGVGMFNALMMSYTRIPFALAKERLLPRVFARTTATGVPWASVLVCAVAWGLAVQMSFERLISIDLVLYGAALLLEFVALVVLRVKEPELVRPFRVPGGMAGAVMAGVGPAVLIAFAMFAAKGERMAGMPALGFAALLAAVGPAVYLLALWRKTHS